MPADPKPTPHHITARTGYRFRAGFQWQTSVDDEVFTDVDLSDYSARLMVKDDPEEAIALFEFRSEIPAGEEEDYGLITLDVDGSIDLSAPVAQTSVWPVGGHVYDLALTPPAGEPFPFLAGRFNVEEGVTR